MAQGFDTIYRSGIVVNQDGVGLRDIGISNGSIAAIGNLGNASAGEIIDATGLHILPGVVDSQVHFREPGLEHKEDLESGSRSAVLGGLFFDTETTGLSGGTGTRAFMIGASDFVPGGLRIRQMLITHLSAEPAMLRAFAGWLGEETRLVSYNGRCYDAPLLATRYRLARLGAPLAGIEHLDLLFPTRRRYRGVWENCRLATIERNALGIVREDDLPGSEAPAAWLQYLRGGDAGLLRRVLLHNFQDVVTLAHLLLHLAQPDAGTPAVEPPFACDPP